MLGSAPISSSEGPPRILSGLPTVTSTRVSSIPSVPSPLTTSPPHSHKDISSSHSPEALARKGFRLTPLAGSPGHHAVISPRVPSPASPLTLTTPPLGPPLLRRSSSSATSERQLHSSDKFVRYRQSSPEMQRLSTASCTTPRCASPATGQRHNNMIQQMASGSAAMAARNYEKENSAEPGEMSQLMGGEEKPRTRQGSECDDVEAARAPQRGPHKNSVRDPSVPDTMLRLNIGGSSYRIRTRSIVKYGPKTLLGRFCRMNHDHRKQWADWYFEEQDEYFFERVPRYFDPIYDFYATGKLHVPKDLCFDKFMAELRFWAVSKSKMDECCSPFAQYCVQLNLPGQEKDHFIGVRCANIRRKLWLVLEGHTESWWWKAFEVTSTSFVVLSIAALILGSIPEFQVPQKTEDGQLVYATATYPTYPNGAGMTVSSRTVVRDGSGNEVEMVEHPVFNWVENICVVYFTFEYLLRFFVAPRKLAFARQILNVIDLLAIAPFFFEILLLAVGISGENVRKVRWAFLTVRLLRVLRVIRIAKLGRFSPGLANFALTIRKSKKQMQMVGVVMMTVVIFFSTLIYFLEKDEPDTKFTSIPAAFWWSVVTMATVGYGDLVPITVAGKLVGSVAIVCGVMVLALPITIMVNNFMQVVKLREEKIIKKYAQGDQV